MLEVLVFCAACASSSCASSGVARSGVLNKIALPSPLVPQAGRPEGVSDGVCSSGVANSRLAAPSEDFLDGVGVFLMGTDTVEWTVLDGLEECRCGLGASTRIWSPSSEWLAESTRDELSKPRNSGEAKESASLLLFLADEAGRGDSMVGVPAELGRAAERGGGVRAGSADFFPDVAPGATSSCAWGEKGAEDGRWGVNCGEGEGDAEDGGCRGGRLRCCCGGEAEVWRCTIFCFLLELEGS